MAQIAVVYHSGFGHTKVIAERVARGASSIDGAVVLLIAAEELQKLEPGQPGGRWDDLNASDCIIFGCPTYMGSVTAELKRVFECTGKIWGRQLWRDKLASGFTNAAATSGDKLNAIQDIYHFTMQHSMIWVSQGLMTTGSTEHDVNRMGSYAGMMAQSRDDSPMVTPPEGDRRTAELFGKRIAEVTLRFVRGKQA
ncbi:MAG: flavodoxin family protein [Phycisphaerales bacterium JB058]|jgi:multimeric flavodoxin WrbA|nr:hypothetical protein [Microbacterium sp.]